MEENSFKPDVISLLAELDAVSVENAARSGTPDINYIDGWLELKWKQNWPVKPTTPLRVEKFTPQQRAWITRRWRAGGNAYVLLRVSKEWLLFNGLWAALFLGRKTESELKKAALHWSSRLEHTFLEVLRIGRATGTKSPLIPAKGSGLTECGVVKTNMPPLSD